MRATLKGTKTLKPFKAWIVVDDNGFYSPMFFRKLREAKHCRSSYAHLRESSFRVVPVKVSQWGS